MGIFRIILERLMENRRMRVEIIGFVFKYLVGLIGKERN